MGSTVSSSLRLQMARTVKGIAEKLREACPEESIAVLTRTTAEASAYSWVAKKYGLILSTVHKFKGLEADNVILNVSKWCFPLIHRDWVYNRILGASIDSITDEEHRLLYVGLTRARKRLYLLSVSPDETSPFIDGSSIEKISERLDSSKVNDYSAPDGTVFVLVSGKTYPHVDDFHQWRFRFEPSMKSWLRTFPDRQSFDDFRKESPWLRNPRITVLTADSMQKIQELYSSSQKKRR